MPHSFNLISSGIVGFRINQGTNGTAEEVIHRINDNVVVARQWDWVLELWIDIDIYRELHHKSYRPQNQ